MHGRYKGRRARARARGSPRILSRTSDHGEFHFIGGLLNALYTRDIAIRENPTRTYRGRSRFESKFRPFRRRLFGLSSPLCALFDVKSRRARLTHAMTSTTKQPVKMYLMHIYDIGFAQREAEVTSTTRLRSSSEEPFVLRIIEHALPNIVADRN